MKNQIIELLRHNSKLSSKDIAVMLGKSEDTITKAIKELEDNKIIVGYRPIINWDKVDTDVVTAFIELKVTPQRNEGFDAVAERIYQYEEVNSVFLMSGAYDLFVEVRGRTIKDVALFVSEKLAQMESVVSTATHFALKSYKFDGVILDGDNKDNREVITL